MILNSIFYVLGEDQLPFSFGLLMKKSNMKRCVICIDAVFLVGLMLFLYSIVASNVNKISSGIGGNGDLAIKLYKSLIGDFQGENFFFSPLSISEALAMTLPGARCSTAAQIKEVLGFRDLSDDLLNPGFSKNVEKICHDPKESCSLKLANRLFGEKTYDFPAEFLESSKMHNWSKIKTVDFRGNPEAARTTINKWVEEKTENKIHDLLPEGSDGITSESVLAIVNAIYFKGRWANTFKPEATQIEPFFVAKNSKRSVEMMHSSAKFGYFEDSKLKSKVLGLPYANSSLYMVVVLPNEVDGLEALENSLETEVVNTWMSSLTWSAKVVVSIPKFKTKSKSSVKEKLIGLGMTDLFSPDKANLDGMASGVKNPLYVSDVIHQAYIEVNEEGAEATAATAVVHRAERSVSVRVKADHPFLYYIWDSQTETILFLGKFVKPSEISNLDV